MPLTDAQREYQRNWKRAKYANNPGERKRVSEQNKRRRGTIKQWFEEELRSKLACSQCGEDHPGVLDFHHLDPSTKEYNIGTIRQSGYSRERVEAEIAKCIVLCANCHRKLHWQERQ